MPDVINKMEHIFIHSEDKMDDENKRLLGLMILKQEKINKNIDDMSKTLCDMNFHNKKLNEDIIQMKRLGLHKNSTCKTYGRDNKKITVNDKVIILTGTKTVKKIVLGFLKVCKVYTPMYK